MAAVETPPPGGARITVVLSDCVAKVALTGAIAMALTAEALILKLTPFPPAGMLTELGSVRFGLALESLNVMPAFAGADSVRVHAATPGVTRLRGVHPTPFNCAAWGIVITPARPSIGTAAPSRDAPSVSVTPMLETTLGVVAASCTATRATAPSPSTPLVMPARMH